MDDVVGSTPGTLGGAFFTAFTRLVRSVLLLCITRNWRASFGMSHLFVCCVAHQAIYHVGSGNVFHWWMDMFLAGVELFSLIQGIVYYKSELVAIAKQLNISAGKLAMIQIAYEYVSPIPIP